MALDRDSTSSCNWWLFLLIFYAVIAEVILEGFPQNIGWVLKHRFNEVAGIKENMIFCGLLYLRILVSVGFLYIIDGKNLIVEK